MGDLGSRGGPMVRRRALFAGVAGLAGLGVGAQAVALGARLDDPRGRGNGHGSDVIPFHGDHQAGITTPPAAHASFVGLDLAPGLDAAGLTGVLAVWTDDAARLTTGRPALADSEPELARLPARLTVTVGLGPGAFTRTGLQARRPRWLRPLPDFAIDRLDDRWGQTDLILQICSDDPMTVAHATRVLVAGVRTKVVMRWVQRGFRESRGARAQEATMRNLMGQVDGTVNPDPAQHGSLIWDDGAHQPWFAGGTSMVLRRIAMDLDGWQELDRHGRELTVGRTLATGAPLTGHRERDEPDFAATRQGVPVIPQSAHIARAHRQSPTEQFLRRGYNYDDPPEPGTSGAASNSGLLFAAFQRDVDAQFVPVQRRLAEHDALNEWTTPIGSAVYAILPGPSPDNPLGSGLRR